MKFSNYIYDIKIFLVSKKMDASPPGFEPGTFGLEVQRAIHCATGTASYFRQALGGI